MLYQTSLTIPANTPASDPAEAEIKLNRGTITHMEVEFPAGCCGLVGVQVWHGGWQLLPWSRSQWLVSDDATPESNAPYPIGDEPTILTVRGYNTDDTHDHTIQVRVVMREGETEEFRNLGQFLEALRGY